MFPMLRKKQWRVLSKEGSEKIMAMHSIIEINHDKAHLWLKDPKFGFNLYHALATLFIDTTNYNQNFDNINKRILKNYGITLLNQHHSSRTFELIEQP